MLGTQGTYATKKRKKPVLKQKKNSESHDVVKSNPSKRHRDRLNMELDRLTDLLPFSEDIRSRLDKLSVLRLSVGYLRVKSYFKATTNSSSSSISSSSSGSSSSSSSSSTSLIPGLNGKNGQNGISGETESFSEGDLLLQALNGFVIVVTSDGLVFYASPTIKEYLGFHESDVVHQSVFDLIHTDDRDLFREQLHFAMNPPLSGAGGPNGLQDSTVLYSPEHLPPENSSFLERSFMCRFRCLLDNSSGFLALKFQGRLKYLHGQSLLRDQQTCTKNQLALFSIAIPLQPHTIVEIRAKMFLFQTRHKLDFTPTGVDSRGQVVLGYSETEIRMKGSGYQFIHAADMMYCANKHTRMIKTGETGMCVFRLLSKSNKWVWVKSNCKLIFKAGRPEFIIAYQKALDNAEGEEHLRQRWKEIPFSFSTGEAVLYNTGPTVDLPLHQFHKKFATDDISQDVPPGSLLDCFLRQEESVYTQSAEPSPSPVDMVFMESRALVTIQGDKWQESDAMEPPGKTVVVKKEAKQSVMAVIDNLEKMAKSGSFCMGLHNLDISNEELSEWESALRRLGQEDNHQNTVNADLDGILANDIFDYIDGILGQEKAGDPPNTRLLNGLNNHRQDPFTQVSPQLCDPGLFKTPSPSHTYSPNNGHYLHQEDTEQPLMDSAHMFNNTQKLSHQGPLHTNTSLPCLQELQLQDIFSPSIEIPELVVPNCLQKNTLPPFQSGGQVSFNYTECPNGITGQTQSSQRVPCPETVLQAPSMAPKGQMLQSTVKAPVNVAPSLMDVLPPLIPCNDLSSAKMPNIPAPFAAPCKQGPSSMDAVNQWPQSHLQKLLYANHVQNGVEPMAACNGQSSESQTFPHTGHWPRNNTGMDRTQHGGLPHGQAATHRNCIFDQHFSTGPAGGVTLPVSGSTTAGAVQPSFGQNGPSLHSFHWSQSKPALGTGRAALNPESAGIMSASEPALNIQHFQENFHQTQQDERLVAELNGIFATPPHDVSMYLAE